MDVRLAVTDDDFDKAGRLLLQLRPKYDLAGLIAQVKAQGVWGYRVAFVEQSGQAVCVAGFAVTTKLAWGKHIYVDDLVTTTQQRSTGAGAAMIAWLRSYAEEQGCQQIHLDSGVTNFDAHRFYLRAGFRIASHHFSIVSSA
jgi:GNAT superfamily N-acetyltransferase